MTTIVLTGGGTGGHIMPNIALIPALREKFSRIYYVGREGGREKVFAESAGVPFFGVPAVKFERDKPLSLLTTPPRLLDCARKAERVLRELMPDVVFCKGGYVSLPCALAARRLHIPVVNHESDLSLGLANKLISRFSCATITSFPETKAKRAVFVGNPLRREIFAPAPLALPLDKSRPTLLFVGGSSGARALNEAVFANLDALTARFNVLHITGKKTDRKRAHYFPCEYTRNIAAYYAAADAVVSRCGANAACELLALKKRVLFVPLSNGASRGDQVENARYYVRKGCALSCGESELSANCIQLIERTLRLPPPPYDYDMDTDKKIAALCLKAARQKAHL